VSCTDSEALGVAILGIARGFGPVFVRAALRANFAEDRDISTPTVIDELCAELCLEGATVLAEAESLDLATALARRDGGGGMPRHLWRPHVHRRSGAVLGQ
jgi:hypothetical protein